MLNRFLNIGLILNSLTKSRYYLYRNGGFMFLHLRGENWNKTAKYCSRKCVSEISLKKIRVFFLSYCWFCLRHFVIIAAKMQYAMNNNPVKFIAECCAEFFGVASYTFSRNKYFSFYGCIFFVVLKRDDIRQKIVLQKFSVDAQKKLVGAEYNVQLLQGFFFPSEYLQHPEFYSRWISYPETGKLIGKKNRQTLNSKP